MGNACAKGGDRGSTDTMSAGGASGIQSRETNLANSSHNPSVSSTYGGENENHMIMSESDNITIDDF